MIKHGRYGLFMRVKKQIDNLQLYNYAKRTVEASAPLGYYSYNVCMNTFRILIDKYRVSNGNYVDTIIFFAPRSEPYRAIVYNRDNASYSGAARH